MTVTTTARIKTALANRPQELLAAKQHGQKIVGWLNYNIPEELIHALGLIPIKLGFGGDDRLVDIGARYVSSKNCVFIRETVGLFAENQDPYIKLIDLITVDATCIQMYRVAELIKYYFKAKTVILGVPRNFTTPEGLEYFGKEVAFFTEKLEAFAGHKLDPQKLAASIELYNGIRNAVQELYRYQAGDNPQITWHEVLDVVQAGNFLDRRQYLTLLRELLSELEQKQGAPLIKNPYKDVRIFLSGSIISPGDTKLISIIEQVGGRIVGDDLWSGLNQFLKVEIKQPTIGSVAKAYLHRVPHGALPYLDLESDGRLKNLRKLIKDFQAQAVIYHTLRYCDAFTFKANETKDVLKAEGIPFLEIHTEYAGSDYEAIRNRVEAFVELVQIRVGGHRPPS